MGDVVPVTGYIRQIDNSRLYTLLLVLDNLYHINITVTVGKSFLYNTAWRYIYVDVMIYVNIHIDLNQSSSFGITNVITHSFWYVSVFHFYSINSVLEKREIIRVSRISFNVKFLRRKMKLLCWIYQVQHVTGYSYRCFWKLLLSEYDILNCLRTWCNTPNKINVSFLIYFPLETDSDNCAYVCDDRHFTCKRNLILIFVDVNIVSKIRKNVI